MENLTTTEKRNLLADLIVLKSSCGYDISGFMGKPLSYYNFEKVQNGINELANEYFEINGSEFCFTYSSRNI
jgi:hypothetical protein